MLIDETYILTRAASTSLQQVEEAKLSAEKLRVESEAALEGLRTEESMALKALRDWQGRLRSEPPDVNAVLAKLAVNPKSSLAEVGQLYSRHDGEQYALKKIIALKERALVDARARLEAGSLGTLRAQLELKTVSALLLAVKHVEAEKIVRAMDESIELPVGEALTSAIDSVIETQLLIARKELKQ